MAIIDIPEPLDRWLLNGTSLHTLAWQVEGREGQMVSPELLSDDLPIAGWHGELDPHGQQGQQRRPFGRGTWRLTAWVLGVNPTTGAVLDQLGSLAAVQARGEEILRLLHTRSVTITHERADGTTRQAVGHLGNGGVEAELNPNSPWFGRITADLILPDPFWYDTAGVVTASATLTSGGTLSLAPFATASAPQRACVVEFGASSNPSLQHAGQVLSWASVISAGRRLGITCDPRGPSLYAAAGTWAPSYLPFSYQPGPTWFELDPAVSTATFTHTGGGAAFVSVTARLAYLTA